MLGRTVYINHAVQRIVYDVSPLLFTHIKSQRDENHCVLCVYHVGREWQYILLKFITNGKYKRHRCKNVLETQNSLLAISFFDRHLSSGFAVCTTNNLIFFLSLSCITLLLVIGLITYCLGSYMNPVRGQNFFEFQINISLIK